MASLPEPSPARPTGKAASSGGVNLKADALAGANTALSSVPDGMASGLLAGVNPIYGLYGAIAGPIFGGLFSGSKLMVVSTTSAAALMAGQVVSSLPSALREDGLVLLTVCTGLIMLVFGLLRLGRLARFVSYPVMTGFLTGIAVITVLSQLPTVLGVTAEGSNKVTQTMSLLTRLNQADWRSALVGALALTLAVWLPRTRLGSAGSLLAIAVPSALALLLNWRSVAIVQDVGAIPRGLPELHLPDFAALNQSVLTGALALAAVILVQGAGVSQSVPNPDGSRADASRDFVGQGAANIASGVLRGIPVGGSLGSTSLNVVSGATSQWAAVFAGLWVLLLILLLPGVVAQVAMPALAVMMMYASATAIKLDEARSIWRTGLSPRLAVLVTFLATLFLPVQTAVLIGVLLSMALYFYTSSRSVQVTALRVLPGNLFEEGPAPDELRERLTVLQFHGALYFAGARTLEEKLPRVPDSGGPLAVIVRLRGRGPLGATLLEVMDTYGEKLEHLGSRLYLTEVDEEVQRQLQATFKLQHSEFVRVYPQTPVLGEATLHAIQDARQWVNSQENGNG